jgi:hypothetical protein
VYPLLEYDIDTTVNPPDTVEVYTVDVLLNRLTGDKIFPNDVPCIELDPELLPGVCDTVYATRPARAASGLDSTIASYPVVKYPIGRYDFSDPNVINGFIYFYAVTAFDSTGQASSVAKLEGRPAAVEQDGERPQTSVVDPNINGGKVYVVPNPYRGGAEWNLTPNAADPTGAHIDFFNMPAGTWVLRIYTVSGDLVQELRSSDVQLDQSLQQTTPEDGQATWNLISRNGQEIVSGIYMYSVEANGDKQQGTFVVIR